PEIERKVREGFESVFAKSTLTITDVDVRFLGPSMAVAHVRWAMGGAEPPPNMPEPPGGIQLPIFHKQASRWGVASFFRNNRAATTPPPALCHRCIASAQAAPASASDFVAQGLAER